MKLYYSKGACSLAVRIALHEMGIPCEFESVDLKTKRTETGVDFLTINPKGAVPTLITNNHEILTENSVIHQYLADEYQAVSIFPPVDTFKRYRVLEWLNYVATELHKGCSPLFNSKLPREIKDEHFIPTLKNKLNFIDQHLSQHKYLAGDAYTLPDGYLFVILFWLKHFNLELANWKNLSQYFSDLTKRKSISQSLEEEGLS